MDRKKTPKHRPNTTKTPQSTKIGIRLQICRTILSAETILFQLLVFLIPTNLWLALDKNSASVNGIIVDYLIPKLYINDLVILAIFTLALTRYILSTKALPKHLIKLIPYSLCLVPLALSSFQSFNSTASLWFLVKILEMGGLLAWIKVTNPHLQTLTLPLILSIGFESLIALVQWLQKASVLGFLFFGETSLKISSNIAKSSLGGELRPLPYGTTPHPNLLAGFIAIGLLILLVIRKTSPSHTKSRLSYFRDTSITIAFLGLSLTALLLTQSVTAIVALVIGVLLIRGQHFHPMNLVSSIAIVCAVALFAYPLVDTESISRRISLANISVEMITNKPLLGVGLNNFTAVMSRYGQVPGPSRFLQPVHNIYFLWLAETGIAGTLPLVWLLWDQHRTLVKVIKTNWNLFVPLICLMLIGMLDHYPLTLQTGQLLLTLSLSLVFLKIKN